MIAVKQDWTKLLDILSRQRAEYEQFAAILQKKEKLIIAGKAKELEKLVRDEHNKVDAIEDIERERLSIVAGFDHGDGRPPSLMSILQSAPDEMREPIEKVAMGLMEALNRIAALNRSNAELIQTSMDYIRYNINLLTTSGAKEGVYEGDGKIRSSEKQLSGFLNRQV